MSDVVNGSKEALKEGLEVSQGKIKEGVEKAIKTTEDLLAFGQGNIEAFVKSSQILATGLQDLSKQFAISAQASLEEAVTNFKALAGVKSLKEAVELQSTVAKTHLEKALSESGKLTDASMRLAEQALEPLNQRLHVAAEKFTRAN